MPFGKPLLKREKTRNAGNAGIRCRIPALKSTCAREIELKDIILQFLVHFQYDLRTVTVTRGLAADQPGHVDQGKLLVAPSRRTSTLPAFLALCAEVGVHVG